MVAPGLTVEWRGRVLVLHLASGPANPPDAALRAALIAAVETPNCDRIVLVGAGATFFSAVPMAADGAMPTLAELCAAIEAAPVPVVAVVHGLVMGPGAEVALATRARIAARAARIAFPEVALGLCSQGGTTLRLPQLIGAEAAIDLLLSGKALAAEQALKLGLFDALAEDPLAEALTARLPDDPRIPSAAETLAAVATARRAKVTPGPAAARILSCIEAAALLPPEAHRAFETVAREDLEASPESRALRAIVEAERRAATLPPAVARYRPQPAGTIVLRGAAPALVTLARLALDCGMTVHWDHPSDAARQSSLAALDQAEAGEQRAGRLTAEARKARRVRLMDGPDPGTAGVVQIHSGPPAPGLLRVEGGQVHLVLDGAEGEMGLSLVPSLRACELAVLAEESPEALALALATLRRIGLPPVLVGRRPILGQRLVAAGETALAQLARSGVPQRLLAEALEAFGARLPPGLPEPESDLRPMPADEIVNRWVGALANEALRLLDQGIARRPSDVDHLLVSGHRFPRWRGGPMHLADQRGLLVLRHDLRRWAREHPVWSPAALLDRLIQDGFRLTVLNG